MRSGMRSLADSARFLWLICPEVFESGVRGRLGTIWAAITRVAEEPQPQDGSAVLVDHNPRKLSHAERVFGTPLTLVDPLSLRHQWRWRFLLVVTCGLPNRVRVVAASMIHAANLRHYLRSDENVFLWNPYTLLHFAVDELLGAEATYHLSASYPALRRVRVAHGCSVALDLLGYDRSKRVETLQPWRFERRDPVLVIYLSTLKDVICDAPELSLLRAAREWRDRTVVPIEIFIHYSDRGTALHDPRYTDFFREFGGLVNDRDSLVSSSRQQISLSALSTIGLDLLSMDVAHFVVVPEISGDNPGGAWQSRLDQTRTDLLRVGDGVDQWFQQIRSSQPELFHRVFKADFVAHLNIDY